MEKSIESEREREERRGKRENRTWILLSLLEPPKLLLCKNYFLPPKQCLIFMARSQMRDQRFLYLPEWMTLSLVFRKVDMEDMFCTLVLSSRRQRELEGKRENE